MERMGFRVTHLYGLTESFGPATVCVLPPEIAAAPLEERAAFTARQGVQHPMLEEYDRPRPRDAAARPRRRSDAR